MLSVGWKNCLLLRNFDSSAPIITIPPQFYFCMMVALSVCQLICLHPYTLASWNAFLFICFFSMRPTRGIQSEEGRHGHGSFFLRIFSQIKLQYFYFMFQIDFDDVLAEPSAAHGFDPIWRLSFVLFSQTKLWIYRIISAIVAVPLTILWAIIFSILSVLYVWVIRPIIRIIELFLAVFKRVIIVIILITSFLYW